MSDPAPNEPFKRKHQRAGSDAGPALVDTQLNLARPNAPVIGRVVSSELCTKGIDTTGPHANRVRHIIIDVVGTPLANVIRAGQSFGVIPPGQNHLGKPHSLRLYSAASPSAGEAHNPNHIATTVKRVDDTHWETNEPFKGICSNFLCDRVPGDELSLTGPSGKRFVLPAAAHEHDYLFFATGTGIAPFRAMVFDLLNSPNAPDTRTPLPKIVLIAGVPNNADLLYDGLFTSLADTHPNFTYLTATSREPQASDGSQPCYVQERIRTHAPVLGPMLQSPRSLIYACGVVGMELGIIREMHEALSADELSRWLTIHDDVKDDPDAWTHTMVHRQIKPNRRFFIETY